ncbi:hypothetical protein HPB50_026438 [Hyalomma asiaticum]|uniref:Uncharacterized protein n=1 Tax=Hyalomma asiaticum TaxID=266040 RepID=A0ACB7SG35_HYAAI|nr:hypothetical protein HPB50_026438 [Hyalomma asiaticum]
MPTGFAGTRPDPQGKRCAKEAKLFDKGPGGGTSTARVFCPRSLYKKSSESAIHQSGVAQKGPMINPRPRAATTSLRAASLKGETCRDPSAPVASRRQPRERWQRWIRSGVASSFYSIRRAA